MNRCELIRGELKAYLDRELPFTMRQRVRRHLRRCAACREELSAMEQISKDLSADAPKPLEPSLRDKILAAASGLGPKPEPSTPATSKWRRKPVMAWAVVATALVAWFALYPVMNRRDQIARMMSEPSIKPMAPATGSSASTPMNTPQVPSNAKQIALGFSQYTQNYDDKIAAASPPVSLHKMSSQVAGSAMPAARSPEAVYSWSSADGNSMDGHAKTMASARRDVADKPAGEYNGRRAARAAVPSSPRSGGIDAGGRSMPASEDAERQVHKEAQITVQVDNVEAKSEAVEQITQGVGGYVANNQLSTGDDDARTASLTLKVPVARFQDVLHQVARQGVVKAKNISGEDLTEEISDQQQAEHTLHQDIQATQEQLTHRLSRSGREERLDSLRELRTQLAQKQARLKLLHKLGELSTISVELDERPHTAPPAPKVGGFVQDMNDTLHDAVHSMMQAARLPILTFIWILAYAPLWLLLIFGYRWAIRR